MAESTVYLNPESVGGNLDITRLVHRSTVADGDTLNVLGFPPGLHGQIKIYRGAGATVSVYWSTDAEANIIATTGTKQIWGSGAVTADAAEMIYPGNTGIIIASASGTADVEIVV